MKWDQGNQIRLWEIGLGKHPCLFTKTLCFSWLRESLPVKNYALNFIDTLDIEFQNVVSKVSLHLSV